MVQGSTKGHLRLHMEEGWRAGNGSIRSHRNGLWKNWMPVLGQRSIFTCPLQWGERDAESSVGISSHRSLSWTIGRGGVINKMCRKPLHFGTSSWWLVPFAFSARLGL